MKPFYAPRMFVVLLALVSCHYFFSQNQDAVSLQLRLKQASSDTARLSLLVQLSEVCEMNEIRHYADPAIALADQLTKTNLSAELKRRILNKKAGAFNNIGFFYMSQGNPAKALDYFNKGMKIQEETNDKNGLASSLNNIGGIYSTQGDVSRAIDYFEKSLALEEETGDKKGIITSLNNLGDAFNSQGDIPKALDYHGRSLKISEETGNKTGESIALNNIGNIFISQGDHAKALDFFYKSVKLGEEIGDQNHVAYGLINIGKLYAFSRQTDKALENYAKSLKLLGTLGDKRGIASCMSYMGQAYHQQHNDAKAMDYCYKGLSIQKEIGNKEGITVSFELLSIIRRDLGNFPLAASFADSSLAIAKQLGYPQYIRNSEETCYRIDSARKNFAGAFEHYRRFIFYRDSISNEETHKANLKNQLKYDYDKKEAVMKEKQDKERVVAAEQSRFQQIVIGTVIAGFLLVIVFAGFIYRSLNITRSQKLIIEQKQKEILDSIHYAQRIQAALMPNEKYIDRELKRLN